MADKKITEEIEISADKDRLDMRMIASFLHEHSYWAAERPVKTIKKSIENSLCIGAYHGERQIGFARVVTDYSTIFYVAELFVIPEYQNLGIGHLLMDYIDGIPELKKIRGMLTTRYAHSFYEKHGYSRDHVVIRERIMIKDPAV